MESGVRLAIGEIFPRELHVKRAADGVLQDLVELIGFDVGILQGEEKHTVLRNAGNSNLRKAIWVI